MTALVLALIAGVVIGLALGALGGGGSVLAVPALIYLLGFSPAAATTASLIIVAATSATALYAHARDGHVAWKAGSLFAAAGIIPAYLAGAASGHVPEAALTIAFAVIAALAALRMFRPSASESAGRIRPGKAARVGTGLGAVTGFLGVGGGFLAVPALVSVLGLTMRRAVGTSLLVITAATNTCGMAAALAKLPTTSPAPPTSTPPCEPCRTDTPVDNEDVGDHWRSSEDFFGFNLVAQASYFNTLNLTENPSTTGALC
ncbi:MULTISPECIES: sulfite exporter TauE/SafE family protein [unclassified Streptomyces]|uniref:sulfite exporter TauE/SafE family protein n=1 Tax=unclassified Streptomyces TaxID=2593676 RepID=UPI002E25111D|nr:sulfite exporter TauE/SafE family protein [Streptomyces sp. NBC_01023]